MPIDVLTLSTKGQLVLPSALRKSMSLASGDKLVAYWSNGAIVLKKLELPIESDFEKRNRQDGPVCKGNWNQRTRHSGRH